MDVGRYDVYERTWKSSPGIAGKGVDGLDVDIQAIFIPEAEIRYNVLIFNEGLANNC